MGGTDNDLIPALRQELPFDLLQKVLAKLPISAVMKFCQVCKQWKSLILSVEFAHLCHSVKPVVFYHHHMPRFGGEGVEDPYITIPNVKTDSWQKQYLNFIDGEADLVAADQGLLCFNKRTYTDITLVVYNPLSQKWKTLTAPQDLAMETKFPVDMENDLEVVDLQSKLLVGLAVDEETGSYKLVVACVDEKGPRETLIYDSRANAWRRSASLSPAVCTRMNYASEWQVGRSLCSDGEVYWLVEEIEEDNEYHFKTLVKYNVKLETWTAATHRFPCDCPCSFHFAYHVQDGLVMINFDHPFNRELFPCEFSRLVPDMRQVDREFALLLAEVEDLNRPDKYVPVRAVAQGGFWYIVHEYDSISRLERAEKPLYVFAFGEDPPTAIWLPGLLSNFPERLATFAATLRNFV